MLDWRNSLAGFLDRTWREIEDFEAPRSGTPGLIMLATTNAAGSPACRTLVARRADRHNGTVETYSDVETTKIVELAASPAVAVLIWQPASGLQIRLNGSAIVQSDDLAAEWADIPTRARQNYGVMPPPGTVIPGPGDYERRANPQRLAKLTITVDHIEVVHLARPGDIRAKFSRDDNWAGQWLSP